MGWLFAVALGLQERRLRAVTRPWDRSPSATPWPSGWPPSRSALLGLVIPQRLLLALGGAALLGFAAYKVATRFRHPRWVGMRVGPRELVLWSFLMASAHGAGLMLVPVLVGAAGRGRVERAGPRRARSGTSGTSRPPPATPCSRRWPRSGCTRRRCSPWRRGRRGRLPEGRGRGAAPRLGQPRSRLGRRAGGHRWHRPRARALASRQRLIKAFTADGLLASRLRPLARGANAPRRHGGAGRPVGDERIGRCTT